MKKRIGNELFRFMITMLVLIAMIAMVGLICIQVLKGTSNKIVVEYLELNAIQKLKYSFHVMTDSAHDYILLKRPKDKQQFIQQSNRTFAYLQDLKVVLSSTHSKRMLIQFEKHLNGFRSSIDDIANDNLSRGELIDKADILIRRANHELDKLFGETKREINEYIHTNRVASRHTTISIFILALLLIISSSIWGTRFVKKIIKAIKLLVRSTIKAEAGDLSVRAENISDDEIGELAIYFNRMIESLDRTTVSRDYLDNVLKSMFDAVVVSDINGKILSLNQATLHLLDFQEMELIGQPINKIFYHDEDSPQNSKDPNCVKQALRGDRFSQQKYYRTKSGKPIPVLFSCSAFRDNLGNTKGIVFAAHDISEREKIRLELESSRKERLIAINEAQEEERMRIATEIHDGLGQMLTGISYSVDNYFMDQFENNDPIKNKLHLLHDQIDAAIQESRSIAYDLIPILLKDFGLIVAVNNLITQTNEQGGIKVRFDAFNYPNRLDEKLEKVLYRVIQEALNNILKHSKARMANIQIVKHEDMLSLSIEDDGLGFDLTKTKKKSSKGGIGLMSMKERVQAFNGNISIHSSPNNGVEILIEIPLNL
ncbi:PAS domain S-box protein [Ancylomarina longa]|uniref:Oxygen sensor histidine kinase NreB n=1 Tax=Ancylomarina longa TaxID=2487017 RepID=A0A434AUS2_9BACT|nr:PAS domain S-box protein [Ancylomarina longa]RUT78211.1 PAS domain S-box protein [Ancylomarina longa]